MYYKCLVDIPNVPGKITIKSNTYVLFETKRKYNREKKYNVPSRVSIGKLSADSDGKMHPNETFRKHFPDIDLPEENTGGIKRSSCLRIGAYLVIKYVMEHYRLDSKISDIFKSDAGLFLDLAAYSIVEENNAGQYYPDYAFSHPLFTGGMRRYGDSKVSDFLKSVTDDQRVSFLNEWNNGRDHDHCIYISYDSTNKNIQAGEIEMAEYGHAKDDSSKPIINYSLGYDYRNREPLFYEEYLGSIVDVSQLDCMLDKAVGYGYKHIGFVLDRGYFSRENLRHMDENGYSFIIMAKGNAKFVEKFVSKAKGGFENDRGRRIRKYQVYGTTLKSRLYDTDNRDRYVHIYFNDFAAAAGREKIEREVDGIEEHLGNAIGNTGIPKGAGKYFDLKFDENGLLKSFRADSKKIQALKNKCGYFVIVTSKRMSAEKALTFYKSRDVSEKLFRGDKSYLGNKPYRVQSDESVKAKTLIEFVALIIRNKIFTCLDEEQDKNSKKANYMTVPAAIKELEKIEIVRQSDGIYRMDHAVSATQKNILKAFDMDAKKIKKEASILSKQLMDIDQIKI